MLALIPPSGQKGTLGSWSDGGGKGPPFKQPLAHPDLGPQPDLQERAEPKEGLLQTLE